jgi:hypothetical protein
VPSFFVANTFQIQPPHKGLAIRADVAFCFMPGVMALILIISAGCTAGTPLHKINKVVNRLSHGSDILGKKNIVIH